MRPVLRFTAFGELESYVERSRQFRRAAEDWVSRHEVYQGYCDRCRAVMPMTVSVGAWFGDQPNLREGLRCECGLSNRQRLMFSAVTRLAGDRAPAAVCILERLSPLYYRLLETLPALLGSEYLEAGYPAGSIHRRRGEDVRHEDFCDLSYATASVDLLVHNDILEHIPDFRRALREAFRVLRPGGTMLFTCPFFAMPKTIVRARHDSDGTLVELLPREVHGDGLRKGGILAYYNYGWELVDEIRDAGFSEVQVVVDYDVFRGLTSCNFPEREEGEDLVRCGNMLPLVIEARR